MQWIRDVIINPSGHRSPKNHCHRCDRPRLTLHVFEEQADFGRVRGKTLFFCFECAEKEWPIYQAINDLASIDEGRP